MSNNFWEEVNSLLIEPAEFPSHKLYYDDRGSPIAYTNDVLIGNYIEIDGPTFTRANMRVKVVNGQIIELTDLVYKKLKPIGRGTACTSEDVSIVAPSEYPRQTLWSLKLNDTNI